MKTIKQSDLKSWRLAQGLTQKALGEALGVTDQTVWAWENGGTIGKQSRALFKMIYGIELTVN